MFIELHMLQNFAPSNLNRDDTGAPKDCEFGGVRRARISSQCLKRAIRAAFREDRLVPPANLAARTKRLLDELVGRLEAQGQPRGEAELAIEAALAGMGLRVSEGKTEYLLFLGEAEIDRLAELCVQHWDALVAASRGDGQTKDQPGARQTKKAAKESVPSEVRKAFEQVIDGGRAVDLALFGRMLADRPDKNIDAACQMAHAISTNRVSMEFDFYTAVDDLKPEESSGADMMGTVEFNSACFYRYANVDFQQLLRNLGGDQELARIALWAFLRASASAVPTGKQNSMAAQNPPSLVFAVARTGGLWSLANAFLKPVRADQQGDLVLNSVRCLDAYWGKLERMYGADTLIGKWVASLDEESMDNLGLTRVPGFDELVRQVVDAAVREMPAEVQA